MAENDIHPREAGPALFFLATVIAVAVVVVWLGAFALTHGFLLLGIMPPAIAVLTFGILLRWAGGW